MIDCRNVCKVYRGGGDDVCALDGIDISFDPGSLTAILGPSGCGKTTLLNVLGGLDLDFTGQLVIDGADIHDDADFDWDDYRREEVGFVFQEFNLIEHLNALDNVQAALALAGVAPSERRERARKALERAGIAKLATTLPSKMSGGQKQRVAIARAVARHPRLVLADEPTGSLDHASAHGIMQLLRSIADDGCTVVVVTHEASLAEEFADHIVKLEDGHVVSDSATGATRDSTGAAQAAGDVGIPGVSQGAGAEQIASAAGASRAAASPRSAAAHCASRSARRLDFSGARFLVGGHLRMRLRRSIVAALVVAVGVIGLALLGGLLVGAHDYLDDIEESFLTVYPITVYRDSTTSISAVKNLQDTAGNSAVSTDAVTVEPTLADLLRAYVDAHGNPDLARFRFFLENDLGTTADGITDIQYRYEIPFNIYASDTSGGVVCLKPFSTLQSLVSGSLIDQGGTVSASSFLPTDDTIWRQLIYDSENGSSQYEVLAGRMPTSYDEVVLITDAQGRISDMVSYATGMMDSSTLADSAQAAAFGSSKSADYSTVPYDQILGMTFRAVPGCDLYQRSGDVWADASDDEAYLKSVVDSATTLTVVGIVRPASNVSLGTELGGIGYTAEFPLHLIEEGNASAIAAAQRANPEVDVLTGKPFSDATETGAAARMLAGFDFQGLSETKRAGLEQITDDQATYLRTNFPDYFDTDGRLILEGDAHDALLAMTDDKFSSFLARLETAALSSGYDENLAAFDAVDAGQPSSIVIYPKNFAAERATTAAIDAYNDNLVEGLFPIEYIDEGYQALQVFSQQITVFTGILAAIALVSLLVMMVMIGSMTHISVLERIREIGILRSLGASRREVSRLFVLEAGCIGFLAGALGIILALMVAQPISGLLGSYTGIDGLVRFPLWLIGVILLLSVLLSLLAAVLPARRAGKLDPVETLRSI